MNYRTFAGLLTTFLFLGVFVGHRWDTSGVSVTHPEFDKEGDFKNGPIPQSTTRRVWRSHDYHQLWTVSDKDGLAGPLMAEVDKDEQVFLIDYGDMKVKRVSPSGGRAATLAGGNNFKSLTDLGLAREGVWVADNNAKRITLLSRDGRLLRFVNSELGPYRIAPKGRDFFLMVPFPDVYTFGQITASGKSANSFGEVITVQERSLLALDGWIESVDSEELLYLSQYMGVLARYDRSGHPVYLRNTMSSAPPPNVLRNSKGFNWVDREAPIQALSMSVDRNLVYVLAVINRGLEKKGAIDVYKAYDGSYLYSQKLPDSCEQVIVRGQYLYSVNGANLSKWSMPGEV